MCKFHGSLAGDDLQLYQLQYCRFESIQNQPEAVATSFEEQELLETHGTRRAKACLFSLTKLQRGSDMF